MREETVGGGKRGGGSSLILVFILVMRGSGHTVDLNEYDKKTKTLTLLSNIIQKVARTPDQRRIRTSLFFLLEILCHL